jgi:lipopolysaccharide export system protein LptC
MSASASRADSTARGRTFAASPPSPVGGDEARLRAFAAAQRHSRLVRFLRVAAPIGVVVGVAALIVGALFHPFRVKTAELSIGEVSVDGTKITMGQPKLTGFRRDGRSYVFTAAKAIQDVTRPTLVELHGVDGDLGMTDNDLLHIAAAVGFYDSVKQSLDLSQDVRIYNSSYDVKLVSANIDFKTGVYQSDKPVIVVMANGTTISADLASAVDNGDELTFSGHVRSTFSSEARAAGAPADMKGTNP